MADPIVPLATVLSRLGVSAGSTDEAWASSLNDAVSDEIRRLTRRALEGVATTYHEAYEPEARTLILPHVPVSDVLSVRPIDRWDGTEDEIYLPLDVVAGASTTLAAGAAIAATNLKVAGVTGLAVGDHVRVGAGVTREVFRIKAVGTAGAGGSGLTVEPALRFAQASGTAVVEVAGSAAWRLASAAFGRLELAYTRRLVRVSYRVTGEIPDSISQAALEWVEARWTTTPSRRSGLLSYKTGDDSETYDGKLVAGSPPRDVSRALGLVAHRQGAVV